MAKAKTNEKAKGSKAKGEETAKKSVAAPPAVEAGAPPAATAQGADEPRLEYMRLDKLPPSAEVNPKKHDIDEIKASIARFGFVQAPLMNEASGRLVAGHGRIEGVTELMREGAAVPARVKVDPDGMWRIPVMRGVNFANANEARAYLLADNRLTEVGGWDDEALRKELAALAEQGASLEGIGWNEDEVQALLAETKKFDEGKKGVIDEEEQKRFLAASIKQTSQFFAAEKYDVVVDRMDWVMRKEGLKNHSEVVELLLERYVAANPMPPKEESTNSDGESNAT